MNMKVLTAVAGSGNYSKLAAMLAAFNKYAFKYGIYGKKRIAAFFAQLLHESGAGNYTQEVASGAAYEFRRDLGNVNAGDGRLFKGRGYIQLTGRTNYTLASKELFGSDYLVNNPEAVANSADIAMLVSMWFWQKKALNALADKGDFIAITKKVNGGTNGLASRQAYYSKLLTRLSGVAGNPVLSQVGMALKSLFS